MSMSVCVHGGCLCCGYNCVYVDMCDVCAPVCMGVSVRVSVHVHVCILCLCLCVCLCVYCMCVWSSAWEVGRGGDFLLALPISDHPQAHSPATPWRRSQEQDPALERRGPVLPVLFLKERLMRRFLGASGAERHGLAAEGGVGWKLTSTPGGKPGRGGGLSFTATPHLSSQGTDP